MKPVDDEYDLAALEAALAGSLFEGKLHFSAVTGSTNSDAMTAGRSGAPHGSVFLADEQTAGRGRGNHRWQSLAGLGLYLSVLLRPAMAISDLPLLPLAAGLAAARAIERAAGASVDIRWPNDLLIGKRKTGGILVESRTESGEVAFVVIGIGINVHQRSFAQGLQTPATSLDVASGKPTSRQALLIALLESLEREALLLHDRSLVRAIPARLAQVSTWLSNRSVEVHGPQACVGVTRGLDANGFLLVQTKDGLITVKTGGIRDAGTG